MLEIKLNGLCSVFGEDNDCFLEEVRISYEFILLEYYLNGFCLVLGLDKGCVFIDME